MPDVIRIDDADRVRTVTFDRPDQANAFDEALYLAVAGALADAAADDTVGAVVLTGAGRHFCSGTDLVEMAALAAGMSAVPDERGAEGAAAGGAGGEASGSGHGFVALLDALTSFPKPLLAAVDGAGVGLGLTMLLHCDLVLVSDRARLKAPFAEMGVPPEAASSLLLPVRMGGQAAALALFTSRWITADEAVASGLALRVVPQAELRAEAQALAAEIAAHPLAALVATKQLLLDSRADAVAAARAREDQAFSILLRGQGVEAGILGQLA